MDKKYEDMSYEEVHELLAQAMEEACTRDESGQYQSPDIDLSFLYEEREPEKKKAKKFNISRFGKVAAILIIVLLGMNVVMMATDSSNVYSDKGLLHRIYEGARGIFTDEDDSDIVEFDETGDTYSITDLDNVKDVKKIWPDLYVPRYVPNGYIFERLTIKKDYSGDYFASYVYYNKNNDLIINVLSNEFDLKYLSKDIDDVIELSDRIINIYYDEYNGFNIADIYFEDMLVSINGNIEFLELEKIAKHIDK